MNTRKPGIPALRVHDLSVSFHAAGGPEKVVDGVSFELYPGEIVGLVGESGCGKSVTARALLGLLPPRVATTEVSTMQLDGTELSTLNERGWRSVRGREISMVFQEPGSALDPVLTIGRQLEEVIRRHRTRDRRAARQQAMETLEQGGFPSPGEVYGAYPHQLSGGMRQLAMLAMATATHPRVLIADEPTTALDVSTQSLVLDRLRRLRDRHEMAVLLVSHDLGVVAQSCDRVMVMYCGRIVEQADYARLYGHPLHPYTEGLLKSVPRISARGGDPVKPIPGRVPPPSERPAGCVFADRCARADERCRLQFPPMEEMGGSRVACHHPLGAT
jgi:peptide/nickel transport system ATP-binding protein